MSLLPPSHPLQQLPVGNWIWSGKGRVCMWTWEALVAVPSRPPLCLPTSVLGLDLVSYTTLPLQGTPHPEAQLPWL